MSSFGSNPPQRGGAIAELETLVHHLGEELSIFRRRALQAEARLKALEADSAPAAPRLADVSERAPIDPERVGILERENGELRKRLEVATGRTRQVLDRVRFLRQQQANGRER